jgi:UDP-N-acetylglucosamine--N-acetylmuramyl-(pentapeptide) pyrophosphoryl-undecaprenol N-acetylglucosamine transferase
MSKDGSASPIKVALTGGGTAGHVIPHFALLPEMKRLGWSVFYVGSNGIEKELVGKTNIPFKQITAGKLRRYFSVQNGLDIFKVAFACIQAFFHLLFERPDVVFSKGGFVAVPVAVAAWVLRIPVISHESDMTPGLANKLIKPFSKKMLVTFPETTKYLGAKAVHVGTPVRGNLFQGDVQKGLDMCGFSEADVPTILVMGGSLGSEKINRALEENLPELTKKYQVIHLCGRGKKGQDSGPRYCVFEYVSEGLEHLLALADYVISRAGANAIFEFLALHKPMLLIPLDSGSRGDQLVNAKSFVQQNYARSLDEASLTKEVFMAAVGELVSDADAIKSSQSKFDSSGVANKIIGMLAAASGRT